MSCHRPIVLSPSSFSWIQRKTNFSRDKNKNSLPLIRNLIRWKKKTLDAIKNSGGGSASFQISFLLAIMNIKKQNPWVCSLLFLLPRIFSPFSPFLVVYIWQCLRKWILNETKEAASDAMGTLIHFSEISMTFIVFVVIYFWVEVLNMFWSCKPFSKGCDGRNYLIADICHWLQSLSLRKFS